MNRLIEIRKKQFEIFRELALFEESICCHQISNAVPGTSTLDNVDTEDATSKTNHQKILQDRKRRQLECKLQEYELNIQSYEHSYQKEFNAFESDVHKLKLFRQTSDFGAFIYAVKNYVHQHTQQMMRHIRYKESCHRVLLLRQYLRFHTSPLHHVLDVSPQIILDALEVPLNRSQLNYLSHTGS